MYKKDGSAKKERTDPWGNNRSGVGARPVRDPRKGGDGLGRDREVQGIDRNGAC